MTEHDRAVRHCREIAEAGGRPGVLCCPELEEGVALFLPGLPIRTSTFLEKDKAYTCDMRYVAPTKEEMDRQLDEWLRQSIHKFGMIVNVGRGYWRLFKAG